MVVVALSSTWWLATVSQIDGVNRNLINSRATMGSRNGRSTPGHLPAILRPAEVLRLNMSVPGWWCWSPNPTGVGYGLGQVIMLARNTFKPSLVFFTIALIGLLGFCSTG